MQLLKPGRPQAAWATEATCSGNQCGGGGCGAVLLVEQPDLFLVHRSYMGKETEQFVAFDCIQCGVTTAFEKYDGPPVVPKDPRPLAQRDGYVRTQDFLARLRRGVAGSGVEVLTVERTCGTRPEFRVSMFANNSYHTRVFGGKTDEIALALAALKISETWLQEGE